MQSLQITCNMPVCSGEKLVRSTQAVLIRHWDQNVSKRLLGNMLISIQYVKTIFFANTRITFNNIEIYRL